MAAARRGLAAGLLTLLWVGGVAAQSRPADPARPAAPIGSVASVPAIEDAILVLHAPDLERLKDGYARSFAGRFPRMAGAIGGLQPPVGELLSEVAARAGRLLDSPVSTLRNPLGGPATVAVLAPRPDVPDRPRMVIVLGVRDHALAREYYTKAIANLIRVTGRHDPLDEPPFRIDVFGRDPAASRPAASAAPSGPIGDAGISRDLADDEPMRAVISHLSGGLWTANMPQTLAACLTNDRLIIGSSAADVRAALPAPRVGAALSDPVLAAAAAQVTDRAATLVLLANLPRLFEALSALNPEGVAELWSLLGGRALRGASAAWRFADAGVDARAELHISLEGPRSGMARLLSADPVPLALPRGVPADAMLAAWIHADPAALASDLERVVRILDADAADEFRDSLRAIPTGGSSISIESDLLRKLKSPISIFVAAPASAGAAGRWAITCDASDAAGVDRFIRRVTSELLSAPAAGAAGWHAAWTGLGISASTRDDQLVLQPASSGPLPPPAPSDALAPFRGHVPPSAAFVLMADCRRMLLVAAEGVATTSQPAASGSTAAQLLPRELAQAWVGLSDAAAGLDARQASTHAPATLTTVESSALGIRITQVSVSNSITPSAVKSP